MKFWLLVLKFPLYFLIGNWIFFYLLMAVILFHINPLQIDGDIEKSPPPREDVCNYFSKLSSSDWKRVNRLSHCAKWITHLGPPHSTAEARTTGSADTATGSMVRELLSTALCTSWDNCETTPVSVWSAVCCVVLCVQAMCALGPPDLRPGEGEARPDVLSVDATQEGGRSLQTGTFLPHEKLGVQNRIHLRRERNEPGVRTNLV